MDTMPKLTQKVSELDRRQQMRVSVWDSQSSQSDDEAIDQVFTRTVNLSDEVREVLDIAVVLGNEVGALHQAVAALNARVAELEGPA